MFAFAVWDGGARRMVLARDRFGVKPLYYHRDRSGRLIFASEIKALFVDPSVPRALNEARLAEYLTYRSIAGEETLFADIREVEPGRLAFIANPSGQAQATFPVKSLGEREVVFENPAHDFPQRVIYRLDEAGVLRARIEGTVDGKPRAEDFPMRRVRCENGGL